MIPYDIQLITYFNFLMIAQNVTKWPLPNFHKLARKSLQSFVCTFIPFDKNQCIFILLLLVSRLYRQKIPNAFYGLPGLPPFKKSQLILNNTIMHMYSILEHIVFEFTGRLWGYCLLNTRCNIRSRCIINFFFDKYLSKDLIE